MNPNTITEYRDLPLAVLTESTSNPRRIFENSALRELAESIRVQGVLSPLLVRPLNERGFEIVAGARRYRAAQMAEAETVPVRIVNLTDAEALEAQLVENLIRADVHPMEEATFRIATGLLLAVLLSIVGYQVFRRSSFYAPEALLKQADEMSWLNSWIEAEPLYRQAEQEFTQRHQFSKALYARVSQMPAHSEFSTSIPSQIALLRQDLDLPEAKDPETRLRILTILGMFEVNYDSGMARQTWAEVKALADGQLLRAPRPSRGKGRGTQASAARNVQSGRAAVLLGRLPTRWRTERQAVRRNKIDKIVQEHPMTLKPATSSALPVQLSLRDRHAILENVLAALRKRFYSLEKLTGDWQAAVERHRPLIESAATADAFEKAMSDLLAELHTSHLGFFHNSARRASSRAALSATYLEDETPYGKRWIFQDVHAGGAAAIAGIEPGDILLNVDGREITPPEHPVFAMGKQTSVEFVDRSDQRRTVSVKVARPKGKKLHFIEPILVEARQLGDGLGYLKIAMFPGMIGVEVANEISSAVEKLGAVDNLIIDLRGNTGGGIGALRVMSMITPGTVPVGFALDRRRVTANLESEKHSFHRFSRIPSSTKTLWRLALQFGPAMMTKKPIVLQTEGLGEKPFHGRVVLLVNRHTSSAAEMIVAFARENQLATIAGEKTAGRLLSATSVKVGNGFRLAMPTGAYYTWNGLVLEGTPIEPDELIEFNWRERRAGTDRQLDHAIESIRSRQAVRVR